MNSFARMCGVVVLGLSCSWVEAQNPDVVLSVQDVTSAGSTAAVPIDLSLNMISAAGFSLGVCHDPAVLDAISVDLGATLQAVNLGTGPGFLNINTDPGQGSGFYMALLLESFTPPPVETLDPGFFPAIVTVNYDVLATSGTMTDLCFCETLAFGPGSPVVENVVVNVNGNSEDPTVECGTLQVMTGTQFVRGDCNASGTNNIADVIAILSILFPNGAPIVPDCADSCDTNDDGTLNLADAIAFIDFLFSGAFPPPTPPAPFPDCGADPTMDTLDCQAFNACP